MDYTQYYTFVCVEQMMSEIGKGIGLANQNMYSLSKTQINALAVKDGTITVNFELSSNSKTNDKSLNLPGGLPLLGAKTISLSSKDEENHLINKASIVLNFVSIVPPLENDLKIDGYIKTLKLGTLKDTLADLKIKANNLLTGTEKDLVVNEMNTLSDELSRAADDQARLTILNELILFIKDNTDVFRKVLEI